MRIVQIREANIPIQSLIRNAVIDFSQMTASAVVIETDVVVRGKRVAGYGFNSNGRYAVGGILRERMIPRLLRAPPEALLNDEQTNFDPFKARRAMMANEKPGGHGERPVAVGTLDMALWDAVAKIEEKPLYRLLAERFRGGKAESEVFVYAAGGYYYPGKGLSELQDEIRSYLDLGYDTVKIKIGGASLEDDLRRIEAVLQVVGSGNALAVDANGRFTLEMALRYAEALAPYKLRWYEEPVDPLDFESYAAVSKASTTPLATGENIFSLQDARNLIRHAGLQRERDILQFDPVLSYGLVEFLEIVKMLESYQWSRKQCIPHGGHQFALHLAAGLGLGGNESYPHVFKPIGGFDDEAQIVAGRIRLPDIPGVGIELKKELFEIFDSLK